ncbi:MAG: hypothetical protein ACXW0J_02145 [Nitrososphaeraceae archaeon]
MPNLDPWINQNNSNKNEEYVATKTINKFKNHLLSIKAEHQKQIRPNLHPTYNERHEKIIEMIDWTLEKYKAVANTKKMKQNEEVIIDNNIEELDKKREITINKKKKALLKEEVSIYRLEENTLYYILFRIRELTVNKFY